MYFLLDMEKKLKGIACTTHNERKSSSVDVVFNDSEGRASTEHKTREQEEYVELDISENDPELSEDVLEQSESTEPVPDEPNSE